MTVSSQILLKERYRQKQILKASPKSLAESRNLRMYSGYNSLTKLSCIDSASDQKMTIVRLFLFICSLFSHFTITGNENDLIYNILFYECCEKNAVCDDSAFKFFFKLQLVRSLRILDFLSEIDDNGNFIHRQSQPCQMNVLFFQ